MGNTPSSQQAPQPIMLESTVDNGVFTVISLTLTRVSIDSGEPRQSKMASVGKRIAGIRLAGSTIICTFQATVKMANGEIKTVIVQCEASIDDGIKATISRIHEYYQQVHQSGLIIPGLEKKEVELLDNNMPIIEDYLGSVISIALDRLGATYRLAAETNLKKGAKMLVDNLIHNADNELLVRQSAENARKNIASSASELKAAGRFFAKASLVVTITIDGVDIAKEFYNDRPDRGMYKALLLGASIGAGHLILKTIAASEVVAGLFVGAEVLVGLIALVVIALLATELKRYGEQCLDRGRASYYNSPFYRATSETRDSTRPTIPAKLWPGGAIARPPQQP